MERSFEQVRNRLHFQVVTKNRWLTGHVHTLHRRLIDLLSADDSPVLTMQSVQVGLQSARPVLPHDSDLTVTIAVNRILFAFPLESSSQNDLPQNRQTWLVRKATERAVIGIGQYEIVGNVHLLEGVELRGDFLVTGLPFYAVTDASVSDTEGKLALEHPVVIVNRRRTEYIASAAAMLPQTHAGDGFLASSR